VQSSKKRGLLHYLALSLPLILAIPSPFLPMWSFQLNAPFYGERWLKVVVNPLYGVSGDVEEINIVNHYVGLGRIGNEEIPELAYLPHVYLATVSLAALSVATLNSKRKRLSILFPFARLLLVSSLYLSVYLWLYNYTHTISPGAPIRLEPFDPPFIGEHAIANFIVRSLPDLSLILLTASVIAELLNVYRLRP